MDLQSKKLLLASEKEYTLTVVTTPSDATCTLTYDGQSYNEKTAKVKKGTVVNYSVSYSGTTTKTGSVTMDSDKTLTFTRTYSTSTTYQTFNQPVLKNGDASLGGSSFAVADNGHSGSLAFWKCFDGIIPTSINKDGYFRAGYNSHPSGTLTIYNPDAIKISSIKSYNIQGASSIASNFGTGTVWASNDGTNYTQIATYTGLQATDKSKTGYVIIPVNASNYYKYYQFQNTKIASNLSAAILGAGEWVITATKPVTSYTYYFNLTVS